MSGKSPTEELREEHETGLAQMRDLKTAIGSAGSAAEETGAEVAEDLRSRVETFQRAMLPHFRKEEEGLYPDVQGIAAAGAPAVDILSQFFGEAADDDITAHHLLRGRIREMLALLEATARLGNRGSQWVEGLLSVASASLDLLARHVEKENRLIFPMIERLLDGEQMAAAAARMRAIARGSH
jgi:hemerythrin-like domain-containing protein